ncbi:MAG: vWA domain-containing protein [Bacteroidota bacterium]
MRRLKITLGLLVIATGLGFSYLQMQAGFRLFNPPAVQSPIAAGAFPSLTSAEEVDDKNTSGKNAIRVALLLDTSGSMQGLIAQAKSQLWNILNELTRTEKNGEEPLLEIALYEYGNPRKGGRNQINKLSGFTTDMDLISSQLFSLTTNGGEEYCGQILQTALTELDWGNNPDDLKIIYIAGNEPFTQGPVGYDVACRQAVENDVIVNTIFCGNYQEGVNTYWRAGAVDAKGTYTNIDHNQETAYIQTPYDEKINELNTQLNATYIPYGKDGHLKLQNQSMQDANGKLQSTANLTNRTVFKSSKAYKNTSWDLADAYQEDKSILNRADFLPDTLQNLSVEEMETAIQQVIQERETIQNEIRELDKKRREFKKEKKKNTPKNGLEDSMLKSIKKQAKEKGFKEKNEGP